MYIGDVKRFGSLLFLSLFLLNIAGTYLYFILRQQQIRAQMRLELKHKPVHELDVLYLSEDEFLKARVEEHEVKVDGKMYDIAWVEILDNEVVVYCLHDEAEDNLLSLLDGMLKSAAKDKKPLPSSIQEMSHLQFLLSVCVLPQPEGIFIRHSSNYSRCSYLFSPSLDVPPPRT